MIKGLWEPYYLGETIVGRVLPVEMHPKVGRQCTYCQLSVAPEDPSVLIYGRGFFHKACALERFDLEDLDLNPQLLGGRE